MPVSNQNLKTLCEIFTDTISFVVPDYQRGYSWGDSQLNDLWEDLENLSTDRYHYTGMFTFCEDNSGKGTFEVVDGQQRMTTLIILINELLSKIEGGIEGGSDVASYVKKYLYSQPYGSLKKQYRFQYSVDDPSDSFFKTKILGQEVTEAYLQPKDTLYTRNLMRAKEFFNKKIKDFSQKQLADLFKKVTEHLKFNEYYIDNTDEVYVTFETMNNRGKSLSKLELLKNRLIYLSTLFLALAEGDGQQKNNVQELRKNINNAWKTIYEYLGKSVKKALNDDVFLRDHWIMYFRYNRNVANAFEKDLLSGYFTTKKVLAKELTIDKVNEYVCNLQKSVVAWFSINCPDESALDEGDKEWLVRLNRVGMGFFRPLLMAAYLRLPIESKKDLIKACERYNFLVVKITGRRSNTCDSYFYVQAHDLFVSESPNMKNLIKLVDDKTSEKTNIKKFIGNAVERYQKEEGFYSWSGIRYFLYEYEKYLQSSLETKVEWETFNKNQADKVTIEHILPQTHDDPYWIERFSDESLLNSLGNLLLLSVSKNASLQNDSFEKKKKTIRDANENIIYNGYDCGSYSEIEVSKYEEWTPDSIIIRGKKMLAFLKEHWNIDYDFAEDDDAKLLNKNGVEPTQISEINDDDDSDEEILSSEE